jgi:predicted metalloendopeptidase
MSLAEMEALTPNFPWKSYFTKLGLKPNQMEQVVVGQPEFLRRFGELVKTVPKEYLRWNVIRSTASYLSEPYVQEVFDFYGKTLSGLKELKPRWKRVLSVVDGNLGEALGQLYVAKAFPPEAKKQALTMVKDIQNALRGILKNLEWMGPETRAQAIKKLDAMTVKIGYPDKWRDYSKYHVKDQAYILNILAGQEFDTDYHLEMVGKPVDRTLWAMTPAAVNAYYNPVQNEIVFPAGILQPPFFDFQADIAVNYGGIGAVIGHEITHGFDDQGRQYDADGNLKNWWTAEDEKNFKARAQKIVTQFNAYVPIDDLHINGELTEGENIADLGGVKIAFKALQAALARSPQTGKIGNFTPIQRFFLSWAQVWECNTRPEALRLQLLTDPHSPAKYRVNGPLSNLPEFAEAFQIPQGSPMARPASERVEIW